VKWIDDERANWLSIRVQAAKRSVTLTLKETRGPFTTFRREVELTTIDEAELTQAWLWLCGCLRFATPAEEEAARRGAKGA
jgi:hypothetical protein